MKPQGLISARVFINMDVMLLAPWCQATRFQSGGKGSLPSVGWCRPLLPRPAGCFLGCLPCVPAMCGYHCMYALCQACPEHLSVVSSHLSLENQYIPAVIYRWSSEFEVGKKRKT